MNDELRDDAVLEAIRDARPALPAATDSPYSRDAQLLLARLLADDPPRRLRPGRRTRNGGRGRSGSVARLGSVGFAGWAGWVVPLAGALTAIAVFAVALGLLGGHKKPETSSAQIGAAAAPLSASQYAFAVGGDLSLMSSPAELRAGGRAIFQAQQILRQRCMARHGVGYVIEAPRVAALSSNTGFPSTFYPQPVLYARDALVALRATQGFGIHVGALTRPAPDPEDGYVRRLTPAQRTRWLRAWQGSNGCLRTADVQLYGTRHTATLVGQLPNAIYNYLDGLVYDAKGNLDRSRRGTAAAVTRWSRCMRARTGHDYADENVLISALTGRYGRAQQRTASFAHTEITLAVADAQCAYSSGQAQIFAAAFRSGADHLPAKLDSDLRYLLARRPDWIRRARQIVRVVKPLPPVLRVRG